MVITSDTIHTYLHMYIYSQRICSRCLASDLSCSGSFLFFSSACNSSSTRCTDIHYKFIFHSEGNIPLNFYVASISSHVQENSRTAKLQREGKILLSLNYQRASFPSELLVLVNILLDILNILQLRSAPIANYHLLFIAPNRLHL